MKIVVLDAIGLHAGFLGCYGNESVGTPTLDSLACEGVVFDNHIADCPVLSADTISSARTGRPGFANRKANDFDLLDLCKQRDWQVDLVRPETLPNFVAPLLRLVKKWQPDRSALLWVDGPSLVPPWSLRTDLLASYFDDEDETEPWPRPSQGVQTKLSEEDWQRLRYTYAAVVTYFDAQLGVLCESIVEQGWADETLLCVTGRSGLPLGEHDQIGEGPLLYAERVHVPLVMRLPGEKYAGLRVAALTQPVDFLATFMDYVFQEGNAAPNPNSGEVGYERGASFLPLLEEERDSIRDFAVAALSATAPRNAYLRTREWALVVTRDGGVERRQLFRKPEDRWEVNDLSLKNLEKTDELEQALNNSLTAEPFSKKS
jgi:arylsulfatase A-like enzyme